LRRVINHLELFEVARDYEFGDSQKAIQHIPHPGKTGIVLLRSPASEGWRMEIGTVGAGAFAQAFAKQALKAGHKIKLSNSRGRDSLREIVNQLGPGATAASKEEAAACEMVLLAVPWDNVPETLASLPKWKNQILIDGTNPYHGKARNFTPANVGNLSTSQLVAALAPGARVVKALNNMSVPNLEADPVVNGARRVAFISADDDGAKNRVESLLEAFGYAVVDLGNLRSGGLIQQAGGPLAGRDFLERGEFYK
jgi:predicted dinucleotide-binding enzyme